MSSQDLLGTCCSIALVACLDLCTAICIDFASIRHAFTETMFKCPTRPRSEHLQGGGERARLIQQTQPAPSTPMVPDGR
ncbi:hypothetical protein F5148DRAFT_1166404 [Russula earlei]|uniref:Uncharacterized protein n=1 Tax=Russula earlei TaxID=71964 RepID=A0ACC0ULJ6_9AGAM|nr:hypothetical protein F5148DRAFT_1166404 [Russula earlei]